jgi:hypothetical protein
MRGRAYVLVTLGLLWLAADLWMMFTNIILRETRIGIIAVALDRLPHLISTPVFFVLWTTLFFGWAVLVIIGLRRLLRGRRPN